MPDPNTDPIPPFPSPSQQQIVVSPQKTLLPVAAALSICTAAVGLALWLNTKFSSIDTGLLLANTKIDAVSKDVTELGNRAQQIESKIDSQFWSTREMRQWVKLLKAKNPTLEIPDVE